MGTMEEQVRGVEDMRGIEAFISWCTGPNALEIRRIAGMAPEPVTATIDLSANAAAMGGKGAAETVLAVERPEDFLMQLKKKHAKTRDGEESRWAGTALGREKEREGRVRIEGWEGVEELGDWGERFRRKGNDGVVEVGDEGDEMGPGRSESSSPLSEISAATAT